MQIGFQERDNINKRETKEKKLGFLLKILGLGLSRRICVGVLVKLRV